MILDLAVLSQYTRVADDGRQHLMTIEELSNVRLTSKEIQAACDVTVR